MSSVERLANPSRQFVVPPLGGVMPPKGGTTNFDLVCFFPEITFYTKRLSHPGTVT
ncbi:hypothetical protein QUF80_00410 [Desulfococcaceae bacterium HSG8]|nr:hypothetical protein [Desulfococcaceae bacterium HSG8]